MDDLGYGDLGSYGVPDAKTPNLDRLAREGVRLTDFYANAANCSPTRAGLISGRYQQRYGIEQPIPTGNTEIGLLPSETSLPRLLKTAGYTTGLVGKWHLGAGPQFRPGRHGFDEFWGFLGSSSDYYRHGWAPADAAGRIAPEKLTSDLFYNDERVAYDGYLTDGITVNAKCFVHKAVRRGSLKFLREGSGTVEGNHEFLFDLAADPGERTDLSQARPDVVRQMRQLVAHWEADLTAEFTQRQLVITPGVHASIQIEHAGTVIHVDPWSVGDLSKAKPADLILITDDVGHHLDVKAIGRLRKAGAPVVIAANGLTQVPDGIVMSNGDTRDFGAVRVEAIGAYDIKPGDPYHPKGEANGYVINVGGQRIYVVGVTECVPEVKAVTNVDVAFFPLNLPLARMEAATAIECITAMAPKVVYPYHYDQDWVRPVPAGGARPTPTTRGLQDRAANSSARMAPAVCVLTFLVAH